MADAIAIAAETPLQDDVRRLVTDLDSYLVPLSPPEFHFPLSVEEMAEPAVTTFVARDAAGRALGMIALKVHDDGVGEVKRMWTDPQVRGRRVGSALLRELETVAGGKGVSRLVLETGEVPGFEAAWRVYERAGFTVCGAVLDYPDSGYSRFYTKTLTR